MPRLWLPWDGPPNDAFELNSASPQAEGLERWWPALGSRGSSQLRDYGSCESMSVQSGASYVSDGEAGWALDCDGATGFAYQASLSTRITDTLTWTCWVRPDTLASDGFYCFFSYGGYIPGGFMFNRANLVDYSNRLFLDWGGTDIYQGAVVNTAGEWYFMAITVKDGVPQNHWVGRESTGLVKTAMTRYIGSTTLSATSPQNTAIGRREDSGTQYVDGRFGDHRLYRCVLADNLVEQLWDRSTRWELYGAVPRTRGIRAAVAALSLRFRRTIAPRTGTRSMNW